MHDILLRVFEWSYFAYFGIAVLLLLSWTIFAVLLRKYSNVWRVINIIGACVVVFVILCVTLLTRTRGEQLLRLIPFSSFELAIVYNDVYKQIVMNMLLFIPFGLAFPFVFQKTKHPVLWTILLAILFSLVLETFQCVFALGEAETDDIIFNTVGAAIGTLPFMIMNRLKNRIEKNEQ